MIYRTHLRASWYRLASVPMVVVGLCLAGSDGGASLHAADLTESDDRVVPLPLPVVADPLGMPVVPPSGLGRWLETTSATDDGIRPPAIETVARPLEEFVKTPWKAPVFGAPTRPGLLVRQQGQLLWGIDAEWRVGVAVDSTGPGKGEFADATQWTIRKEVAGDFFIYLHDRGSGFVKNFGERMSVFGRYITTGDKSNPVSTVQFGAAKSY
ncbi:MAG: hypothetical protein WCH79_01890 [Planctomycetia bacterium]